MNEERNPEPIKKAILQTMSETWTNSDNIFDAHGTHREKVVWANITRISADKDYLETQKSLLSTLLGLKRIYPATAHKGAVNDL